MEVIYTGKIENTAGVKGIKNPELSAFLAEWFDDNTYSLGHTSGSTGTPKEIRLYKKDMLASARLTNRFFGITESSVLLLCLSVSYIAGKMMVIRALEAGAVLICAEVSSHPLKGFEGTGEKIFPGFIDLAAMVPMQVEETIKVEEEKRQLGKIRHLLIGGAPISAGLEEQLKNMPVCCYATYGMTETVSHVALKKLGSGKPYFALGEIIFHQDKRECLVIDAPHLSVRRFVTNDMVRLIDDTHFEWLGRYDHVVNSGGIKFFPEQIEQKIRGCIPVCFFITSLPDIRLGQRLVLVLEKDCLSAEELSALYSQLRQFLKPYEMPKEVFCCPYFQRTSSGKVKRIMEKATRMSWNDV